MTLVEYKERHDLIKQMPSAIQSAFALAKKRTGLSIKEIISDNSGKEYLFARRIILLFLKKEFKQYSTINYMDFIRIIDPVRTLQWSNLLTIKNTYETIDDFLREETSKSESGYF